MVGRVPYSDASTLPTLELPLSQMTGRNVFGEVWFLSPGLLVITFANPFSLQLKCSEGFTSRCQGGSPNWTPQRLSKAKPTRVDEVAQAGRSRVKLT